MDLAARRQETQELITKIKTPVRPLPLDGFDPLNATNQDLVKYWYPPRPRNKSSKLYKLWEQAASSSLRFIIPEFKILDENIKPRQPKFGVDRSNSVDEFYSGAIIKAPAPGLYFQNVIATWTVPAAGTLYPQLFLDGKPFPPDSNYGVATWIGVDVDLANAIPGIAFGVTSFISVQNGEVVSPNPAPIVWYQWGTGSGSLVALSFPVEVGHQVQAIICGTKGNTNALIGIRNITTGDTSGFMPIDSQSGSTFEGNNVEWFVSQHPPDGSFGAWPLTNFGEIIFTDILATATTIGGGTDSPDTDYDLSSSNVVLYNLQQLWFDANYTVATAASISSTQLTVTSMKA